MLLSSITAGAAMMPPDLSANYFAASASCDECVARARLEREGISGAGAKKGHWRE